MQLSDITMSLSQYKYNRLCTATFIINQQTQPITRAYRQNYQSLITQGTVSLRLLGASILIQSIPI